MFERYDLPIIPLLHASLADIFWKKSRQSYIGLPDMCIDRNGVGPLLFILALNFFQHDLKLEDWGLSRGVES